MNRRTAVRNIVIISAGASLLPACTTTEEASIPLKNISVTGSQQNMLAELCETIIPKTNNFIGAKDLKSHEFALIMIDDCASPEIQKTFTDGINAFENACEKKFNTSFVKLSSQQKTALLNDMEVIAGYKAPNDEAAKFYKTIKGFTIQSFTSSKDYMLDVRKWKMVPGTNFKGCVPVHKA